MTKAGRDRKIQARLNKATYPMIITGWEGKNERKQVRQLGIETAKKMQAAKPIIHNRIKDLLIRGTSAFFH